MTCNTLCKILCEWCNIPAVYFILLSIMSNGESSESEEAMAECAEEVTDEQIATLQAEVQFVFYFAASLIA